MTQTHDMSKKSGVVGIKAQPKEVDSTVYPQQVEFVTKDNNGQRITENLSYKEAMEILTNTANTKETSLNRVRYGEIPDNQAAEAQASAAKQNVKLDVNGFKRVIDSDDIRHMINKHGDPVEEKGKGQIAITMDDIKRIPEIVANPDKVEYGGKTRRTNLNMIKYTKRINGEIYYFEEARTGEKELAAKTLYKKPSETKEGSRDDVYPHEKGSSGTSETLPCLPSYDSTIPKPDEVVKGAGS